jgi:hypothetical protein
MTVVQGWRRCIRTLLVAVVVLAALPVHTSFAQSSAATPEKSGKTNVFDSIFGLKRDTKDGGWLFAASREDGEAGVYFAISKDGYQWTFVNDAKPVARRTEKDELMGDPFLQRAPDGSVRMVWTWSKGGVPAGIGYSSSFDLVHWVQHRKLALTASIPGALTSRAPAMYYDAAKKDWVILWTSSVLPNATASPEDHIYATTTTDFKKFAPAKVFFDPGYSVADATLVNSGTLAQRYCLLFQDERTSPLDERIHMATGPSLEGPWQVSSGAISDAWADAPAAIPVTGGLLVYYHHAHDAGDVYGAAFTADMEHWTDTSIKTMFPGGMRHGSFLPISDDEYQMLKDYYFRVTNGLEK